MGCDGGTIPKRDELVKTKKKPEKKDKDADLFCKWRLCAITQQRLQAPIVSCELGRLYNKESILELLLDKSKMVDVAKHIRNLKDLKELVLTPNPSYEKAASKGDAYNDLQAAEYICPVIGLEMNGKFKFCYIWTCGCVMSERALKEIKTTVCHKCQKPFKEEDIIILNPSDEEITKQTTQMDVRRFQAKTEKKSQKRNGTNNDKKTESKKLKTDAQPGSSNIAKTLIKLEDPALSKVKSNYSIAKDPNASEVYKSIFTSHDKSKNQMKPHWVTYNPFYN
nr:EOG090X0ACT [Cyclestheria hislopi]